MNPGSLRHTRQRSCWWNHQKHLFIARDILLQPEYIRYAKTH